MNMTRTKKDGEVETSERAAAHGLKRIPRRHVTQPGEVKLSDCKVKVTMYLDADVLEYFKARAGAPNAAPYQTQINSELRAVMENSAGTSYDALLSDERFIEAVAEKVRRRA